MSRGFFKIVCKTAELSLIVIRQLSADFRPAKCKFLLVES